MEVETEAGRTWELRRRFSEFSRLRSALGPYAGTEGLPASWDAVRKLSGWVPGLPALSAQRCAAAAAAAHSLRAGSWRGVVTC